MLRAATVFSLLHLLVGCDQRDHAATAATVSLLVPGQDALQSPPDFNREVRPILSDHCYRCHGPDASTRKRGLRLDSLEGAVLELRSGKRAIVPGDIESSEAAARIMSDDPGEVMPPPEMKHALTPAQRTVILDWIRAGAEYQPHWAFAMPAASPLPAIADVSWCRDPIDAFVLAKIEHEKLSPSPEADRAALLRRVSLALTGLPPTPDETDAFLADQSPHAYEAQIDRLLSSSKYGERMASDWLDVARFADTFGYQSDWDCRVWPWRDWLINALNSNLPYDRFVRDQIAGDLQPGATREQRIATAFNRLHRQTNEGGSIDEEFRQEYVSDRTQTFGTAFLGLTVECARCHDHKYDPISQTEYYSLGAFFGSIDEAGTYSYSTPSVPSPTVRLSTPEQDAELARLADAARKAEADLLAATEASKRECAPWLERARNIVVPSPVRRFPLEGTESSPSGTATLLDGDSGPSFTDVPPFRRCDALSLVFWMKSPDRKTRATIIHTSRFTIESDQQGYQVMLKDGHLCWEIIHSWPGSAAAIQSAEDFPVARWVHVAVTYDGSSRADGMHIWLDGKPATSQIVRDHLDGPTTARTFEVGHRDRDQGFKGGALADVQVFDRDLSRLEVLELLKPGSIESVRGQPIKPENARGVQELYARTVDERSQLAAKQLREARAAYQDLLESIPELMVMEESKYPRESFVLSRGQYDQPDRTRPVRADRAIDGVLQFEPTWPRDRSGLALWTTDPRNPLTARVAVNRLWSICFGRGIVPTLENFGLQGEAPTHPELLDTLAADFVRSGWDVKAMLRRIVLSATFRQSSNADPAKLAKDPENKLLARGPVIRLSAESLRDQALAASGLLVQKIGGPSVKPWQPPGLWGDAGASSQGDYAPDTGENAHRRSLYTYRKRTAPPPNMLAFDAGSREKCLARRQSTNTPLQPLVLLNDPVFFECARALADRAQRESGDDPRKQIVRAFRLLVSRPPRDTELQALVTLYDQQVTEMTADESAVKSVLASDRPDPRRAAMVLVCSTLLATDAAVTSR